MNEPIDLLVIAAHPDDAELAVGGTLLVAKDRGHRTAVIDLTRGELSSRGDLETRARETEDATERLGLSARLNLDLPDGDVRDAHDSRVRLVEAIRRLRPRVMLAPWKEDLHPDHAGAGRLAERSWYLCGVGKFAPGEPPYRPEVLGYYMCHTPFEASVVVDVGEVWARRVEAVLAYRSQFHQEGLEAPATKIGRSDFMAAVEGRAREYGLLVGAEFGEPLRWQLPPRVGDPVGFLDPKGDLR